MYFGGPVHRTKIVAPNLGLNLGPKLRPKLGPKSGPKLGPKFGPKFSPFKNGFFRSLKGLGERSGGRFGCTVWAYSLGARFGVRFGQTVWVHGLGVQFGCTVWVYGLGVRFGCTVCADERQHNRFTRIRKKYEIKNNNLGRNLAPKGFACILSCPISLP